MGSDFFMGGQAPGRAFASPAEHERIRTWAKRKAAKLLLSDGEWEELSASTAAYSSPKCPPANPTRRVRQQNCAREESDG